MGEFDERLETIEEFLDSSCRWKNEQMQNEFDKMYERALKPKKQTP